MASPEGGGDDFGDSLFEGMVLFTPSDPLSSSSPSDDPPPQPSRQAIPPPSPSPSPASTSNPLDEDLFSDLTLQPQIETPSPSPPAAQPPPLSRQISRKKKRAVRIGYGRDSTFTSPDEPSPPSPLPIPHTPSPPPSQPEEPQEERQSPSPPELADQSTEGVDQTDGGSSESVLEEDRDKLDDESVREEEISTAIASKEDAFGSIEDKLERVKAQIAEELRRIRDMAALVSAKGKELTRRRRKAMEDVSLAGSKYRQLERELEEACEVEDFEKAERVSESLASAEVEKDELLSALRDAELECDAMDLKLEEVLELQIAAEEEGAAMLEQLAKDAVDHADLVLKTAEENSVNEIEVWESSLELLEIQRLEISIESQLIVEARSGLEHSIEHLVEDDRKDKENLMRRRNILANELNELLELVKMKEEEIAENDSRIQGVEKRLFDIRSEFIETKSNIDMKHENLQLSLSKIESDSEALIAKKKEMDEFISQAQEKRSKLMELASIHLDEARICQDLVGLRRTLASSVLKSREDKVKLSKTEDKILEEVQILRQQISTARTALQELSSTRASIQQEVASNKQRMGFIDKRGPELEAEKKVAAAARNFKEAGRIAAEAKALTLEKDAMQNKQEKALSELEKLEEDINCTLDKIQECEGLILLKEKEAAMAGCRRLHLIAATARADRSAALELGDTEEADILLKEAEAAEAKAKELQGAYELELEECGKAHEHLVSIALITNLAGQHLAEMVSSLYLPATSSSLLELTNQE